MTRLNLVLIAALILSCLYLVKTAYDSRSLFNELDRARTEQGRLDNDYKRLEAERQAQATHLRVERVAREKLGMRMATPDITRYVGDARAASGATP